MMPILWRYLIKSYLKLFALSLTSFIGMLLVVRFQEIATFACSGSSLPLVVLFTFYQIPYILPFAIPISCLLSSLILFMQLCKKQEITALRSAGISLKALQTPLLFTALLLSLSNFVISSEIAPRCKALSKDLLYHATTQNPLFAFQKNSPIKINNAHINVGTTRSDHSADNVLLVVKNSSEDRLGVIIAKKLFLQEGSLVGKNVSILSYLNTRSDAIADHLVIENQERMDTQAKNISQVLQGADWNRSNECLNFRMLRAKLLIPKLANHNKAVYIEIFKRLSLAISPFLLTWLGATFGMKIGRGENRRNTVIVTLTTSFYLMTFLAAKSIKHSLLLSGLLFFLPHLCIALICLFTSSRINKGVET